MLQQLALVSEVASIRFDELARVSAALQKQAMRDLAPIWGVQATVDPFARLEDVPLGYWPIIVVGQVSGGAGVHLDRDGQPFALVEAGPSWSLTASHEMLEMLVDPFGNRLVAGYSPKPGQGRVEFLVEVADPSEDDDFGYTSNGILVSDFYTPHYFDPQVAPGVRYSFTGAIKEPRQVLRGGYLSWHEPVSDHWWQLVYFDFEPEFRDLGRLTMKGQSLRAMIDAATPETKRLSRLAADRTSQRRMMSAQAATAPSMASKAGSWRRQMAAFLKPADRRTLGAARPPRRSAGARKPR